MTRRTAVDPTKPSGPPASEPCYECPARTTNEHKQLTYEVAGINEFAKIWWEISRKGRKYACHMTDRECAGTVNMIAAELRKLGQFKTWEDYTAANPLGLAPEVIGTFLERVDARRSGRIPVADPQQIILTILNNRNVKDN